MWGFPKLQADVNGSRRFLGPHHIPSTVISGKRLILSYTYRPSALPSFMKVSSCWIPCLTNISKCFGIDESPKAPSILSPPTSNASRSGAKAYHRKSESTARFSPLAISGLYSKSGVEAIIASKKPVLFFVMTNYWIAYSWILPKGIVLRCLQS